MPSTLIPPASDPTLDALVALHHHDAVMVLSPQGRVLHETPSLSRIWPGSSSSRVGQTAFEWVAPADRQRVRQAFETLVAQGAPGGETSLQFAVVLDARRQLDVQARWVDCTVREQLPCVLQYLRPMESTALRAAADELWQLMQAAEPHTRGHLRSLLQLGGHALEASRCSFWRYSHSQRSLQFELGWCVDKEHQAEAGRMISERDHPEYFAALSRQRPIWVHEIASDPVTAAHAEEYRQRGVVALMDHPVWLHDRLRGVICLEFAQARQSWTTAEQAFLSHLSTLVALALEAARRREIERRHRHAALHDALTGLPNRLQFQTRLTEVLQGRGQQRHALMLLDLDHFKDLNDTRGHLAGDELLRRLGSRLATCVREGDLLARMGGDEFVYLMCGVTHDDDVLQQAKLLHEAVRAEPLSQSLATPISTSIGVAIYPDHGQAPTELLQNADMALYDAKHAAGDRVCFFNQAARERSLRAIELATLVRRALDESLFELHYQPVFDLASGDAVSLEALIRMRDAKGGYLPPEAFIAVAEQRGNMARISDWVIKAVCAQMISWRDAGLSLPVAVNLSGSEFANAALPAQLAQTLRTTGIEPHSLSIEITEKALLQDSEASTEVLNAIHALGVGLVIDDFGVGYSTLSYLRRIPASRLKLDRTFVADLPDNADALAIATAVIAMGRQLGKRIICEGIETAQQAHLLANLGAHEGQGFWRSPPLSAPDVIPFLRRAGAAS
jgi:diguanylate cyclase (GGDEF)-like protein